MWAVSPQADGRISLPEAIPMGFSSSSSHAASPPPAAPAAAAAAAVGAAPTGEIKAPEALQLSPLPDFGNMRLVLKVTFKETTPLRQLSNTNSGGERSLVAVLYLLAVQVGVCRCLEETLEDACRGRFGCWASLGCRVKQL